MQGMWMMAANSISLGRLFGVEVRVDASWVFIALLFGWSFYLQFEAQPADLDPMANVLLSAGSVIVFFASLLAHELSHSVMARRLGIPVEDITLFLFGGVTRTRMEANRPRDEFLIAIVGPLTSVGIAGVLWVAVQWLSEVVPEPIPFAIGYIAWLNLFLGVFNLLPGMPLDGGRVLRSILWKTSGSLTVATRRAAGAGKLLASVLIGLGIFVVFAGDLSGLWIAAIGWFMFQAASVTGYDSVLRQVLHEVKASELMSPNPVTIPSDITIREAVEEYFLRYDHAAFPIVDLDRQALLTIKAVRQIPRDQWDIRQAWSVATSIDDTCTVEADTKMDVVMERLRQEDQDRVLVVDGDSILGIITPSDIMRWVRRSQELGLAERVG
jgi:Zn-dependent protease/predicted transcriptional regulator